MKLTYDERIDELTILLEVLNRHRAAAGEDPFRIVSMEDNPPKPEEAFNPYANRPGKSEWVEIPEARIKNMFEDCPEGFGLEPFRKPDDAAKEATEAGEAVYWASNNNPGPGGWVPMPAPKSDRQITLENAIKHTVGARDKEYGSPIENFEDIAALWQVYLFRKYGSDVQLTGEDVAWMMNLMKMARTFRGATKADTYEDAAAYPAIAFELANQCRKGE